MSTATRAAREAVQALVDAGVRHVVLCPGSRSAPLAYAVHAADDAGLLALHVRHDERVAGFIALGLGRAGALAAVVTTSGSAVANLAPAVLEASEAGVPMVVLSADRPRALRGTWANQTSAAQPGLLAAAARRVVDVDDRVFEAVTSALATARGTGGARPGPVHVNLALADPLVPDGPWSPSPGVTRSSAAAPQRVAELRQGPRTVVVAGDGAGGGARELAEGAQWPLLAEPSSGARGGSSAVPGYRLLLADDDLGGAIERVVVMGRPTLSRPVARLLASVEVVLVSPWDAWPEPGPAVPRLTRVVADRVVSSGVADRRWTGRWRAAASAAGVALDRVLDGGPLIGPLVAREVGRACAATGSVLVAAASNPVRDLDLAADRLPGRVHANRGVSGIDGTVSTAIGVSLASGPVCVVVGDVAFLHDAGALLVGPADVRPDVRVVVVNDDGGGIFALLEHGEPDRAATFERLFGTPHGADLGALCAGYGIPHRRVVDRAGLAAALARAPSGMEVVEVPLDRSRLRERHESLRRAVQDEVRAALARDGLGR